MGVRIGCGLSTDPDPHRAARAAGRGAAAALGGDADLALVFASGAHLAAPLALLESVHDTVCVSAISGCGAGGVVGGPHEIEGGTAVAVWAADLGGGVARTFHADVDDREEGLALAGMPDPAGADGLLLFPDPYSMPTDTVLRALDEACPGTVVLGGLPSARTLGGEAALLCDDHVHGGGVTGVVLRDVGMTACVSQGAVPLGPELTITAAEGHVIHELAGRPALARIRSAIGELDDRERGLVSEGLLLGIVIDTGHVEYRQGDFLVRGVLGVDPDTGSVTVGARVSPGQVVRLHARDAASAHRDLRRVLLDHTDAPVAGALVFTCNNRGSGLFGVPDHDAQAVTAGLGGVPTAGFHAAGEIGPVGRRSFLHGFTATVAVFRA